MADFSHVTLCFSLPRSRSQWLAWVFHAAVDSWHDPLNECERPADLVQAVSNTTRKIFIADTSAVLFHRALTEGLPGARFLYVLRPLPQVAASLARQTGLLATGRLQRQAQALVAAAAAAPFENVCALEDVSEFARRWWPEVTGEPDPGTRFWLKADLTHVDVPVREQKAWPERRARLLQHDETA